MHDEHEDFYYTEPLEGGGNVHILKFMGREVILMYRRKFYTPYNETPTKGSIMDAAKKKMLLKAVFGLGTSLLLGKLIKLERQIEDRINERLDEQYPDPEPTTEN